MSKRYTLIGEKKEEVIELRNKPAAGIPCSYESFRDKLTYKKKYFTIVFALPTSGKSEFVLQECLYLADRHSWKTLLFTPETGDPEDIIALLVHKSLGKSVNQINGVEQAEPEEILKCMKWLNNHFIIVSTEGSVKLEDLFDIADEIEKDLDWKADNFVIDNHNDLDFVLDSTGRQDLAIERQLTYFRRELKKRNAYGFLVTHTADLKAPITEKGITYYPIPNPTQTRGGQSLYRKGYTIVNLWRCPHGLSSPDGIPYQENQSILTVQKAKPTHTGIKGTQLNLYWDWKKSKFSEKAPPIQTYF